MADKTKNKFVKVNVPTNDGRKFFYRAKPKRCSTSKKK